MFLRNGSLIEISWAVFGWFLLYAAGAVMFALLVMYFRH